MLGNELPRLTTPIPGPESRRLAAVLREYECPNTTFISDDWPVFWRDARGACVQDVDGNRFIDATAGFGVMAAGHGHPEIVDAARRQMDAMVHGLGDVHPADRKAELAERLARFIPGGPWKVLFDITGAGAVEAALKTAARATGRHGVLAFRGAYHGLSAGALSVTGWGEFRDPFAPMLNPNVQWIDYPDPFRPPERDVPPLESARKQIDALWSAGFGRQCAAIIVEPILGRGGAVVPPEGFLRLLREKADAAGALLIIDEIMTGFGRTGRDFAFLRDGVRPDLVAIGKGFTGGYPISACVGRKEIMDRWGASDGEAIHTGTFLGSPLGCAMALAAMKVYEQDGLARRAAAMGARARERLARSVSRRAGVGEVRGEGLLIGIDIVRDAASRTPDPERAWAVVRAALRRGVILLAGGARRNVITLTPPLVIAEEQMDFAVDTIDAALGQPEADA
jgi:4-aminobutyrate aminotransferase / (S)-3-amino-2-methylpropionate transaminase / 5-aminovalerate transaminase